MRSMTLLAPTLIVLMLAACAKHESAPAAIAYNSLGRIDFNRRAAEELLPLFWSEDKNNDATLQPDELAVLWGLADDDASVWVANGSFTPKFVDAYARLRQPPAAGTGPEAQRLRLVRDELAQGVVTLVHTDVSKDSPAEQQMVQHLMRVAVLIEKLYARQNGVLEIEAQIPREDVASRAMFHRNQSPFCEAPRTEKIAACNALAVIPKRISGLYPAVIQQEPGFCQRMEKAANAAQLTGHFNIVTGGVEPATWKAVPFPTAWAGDMSAVATELRAAADGFADAEPALVAYLRAAADSFASNDWEPANRAWVAMNAMNSRWYARIGPDEVYFDPCAWKGGFALQLARINPDSIAWQEKLEPHKAAMEQQIAKMAGSPYKARNVQFKLPDFIDVVLNAGDQRNPSGATIGQSLPNWGPVAAAGGRTVAMTNLYTDPDSRERAAKLQSSVFCKASDALHATTGKEEVLDSLLHEAAHNLGPSHDYKVAGKTAPQAFGGPLASTLEELKAQNSSLYLLSLLESRGVLQPDEVLRTLRGGLAWAFGHISRGMYAADGTPRNYSHLAAIQIGSFMEAGALTWVAQMAANDKDMGCLQVDYAKLPVAVEKLEVTVLGIKARADRKGAETLLAKYVDDKDDAYAGVKAAITERYLRSPKASFVYSVSGLSAKAQ
ncbi:MAG: hypothetical protein ABI616_05845 [Pseudomonadota bacterium]